MRIQLDIEIPMRDGVRLYTTEPLAAEVEITGPVELVLHAASSAVETDFTATLVDVHPRGRAIHLCEGIVRTCFLDSYRDPSPIEPEQVTSI